VQWTNERVYMYTCWTNTLIGPCSFNCRAS